MERTADADTRGGRERGFLGYLGRRPQGRRCGAGPFDLCQQHRDRSDGAELQGAGRSLQLLLASGFEQRGGLYPDRGGIADLRVHAGRRLRSDAVPLPEGGVQMDVRRRKAELYGVLQRIFLYDLTDYCREIATRRLLVWRPPFSCYGMCRVSGRPPSSRMTEGIQKAAMPSRQMIAPERRKVVVSPT